MPKLSFITGSLQRYSAFTQEEVGDGFGASLYRLPFGISQFAIVIYSQISLFPPWGNLGKLGTWQEYLLSVHSLTSVYWSLVFIFVISSFVFNKTRGIQFEIVLILLVCLIFLFSNTANMNVRRLIGVYPMIFYSYVYIKETVSYRDKRMLSILSKSGYVILIFSYLLLTL